MTSELIEIEVYPFSTPKVCKDVFNARLAPSYLEEIGGPGGGSFSISTTDPKVIADGTLLDYRNVLKCKVDGLVVGAFLVGKKNSKIIDDDASKEVYAISGENLRTWFEGAQVRPAGGLTKTSFEDRAFNFATERGSWYHADQWATPVNVVGWGDIAGSPWRYAPANWPDAPTAQWIWSTNSYTSAPAGDNYFRYEFTTVTDGKYSLFLGADNSFAVYIDAQLNTSSDPTAPAWTEMTRIDVDLPAGDHVIGIKVNNDAAGPAALIAAFYKAGDATLGTAAELITVTGGAGWLVAGYPDPVPGWTPGEVMRTLLEEAQARGVLFPTWITPTYTDTLDSNGLAWDRDLEWSFGVGDSLTSVLESLEELSCDIWIDPDTFEFNMVRARGVDRSIYTYDLDGISVVSSPLVFEKGKNLLEAGIDGVSEITNSLLLQTNDGWEVIADTSPSVSKYGVLEGTLKADASSNSSSAIATQVFSQKANPEEGATYSIIPTTGHVPFKDFQVGDWVLAPDAGGLSVRRRVMSLSVKEDSKSGQATYAVEFDTIFQDSETRFNKWLKRLSGGSLGGQFASVGGGVSSPLGKPVITTPNLPPQKFPLAPTDVTVTSEGKWTVDGITAFSEVTVTWDPVTGNTDGSATVPAFYEVWGHLTTSTDDSYVMYALVTTNTATFQPFAPGSGWTFKVRALNDADRKSSFSTPKTHTMVGPTAPMAAPSDPVLSSSNGVLIVTWDGKLGITDPPPQLRYVYAKVSPHGLGTFTIQGQALQQAGNIFISGLTVGDSYDVELFAVDGMAITSAASGVATLAVTGVDLGDVQAEIDGAVSDAADALAAATTAATTADGKNSIFLAEEASPPTALAAGDQWWVLGTGDTEGQVIDLQIWNETEADWIPYRIVADSILVPGSAGTISIADGAIVASKITASEELWATVLGAHRIVAEEIQVGSLTGDVLAAGTIKLLNLEPSIGDDLNISANSSITIIAGNLNTVQSGQDALNDNLTEMQTYYKFGVDGAEITRPGSPFSLLLKSDGIDMKAGSNVVSSWSANQMYVPSLVAEKVVLGNHQLEKYGSGTVVRSL